MTPSPDQRPDGRPATFAAELQTIVEGVLDLGFGAALVSLVRDGQTSIVAAGGVEVGRRAEGELTPEELVGRTRPQWVIEDALAVGDSWGVFFFIPHQRVSDQVREAAWTAVDEHIVRDPLAWHPNDFLLAPIRDDDGELRAVLSVDRPDDGVRPDAQRRRQLEQVVERLREMVLAHRDDLGRPAPGDEDADDADRRSAS